MVWFAFHYTQNQRNFQINIGIIIVYNYNIKDFGPLKLLTINNKISDTQYIYIISMVYYKYECIYILLVCL
jgi:hypothetical protein